MKAAGSAWLEEHPKGSGKFRVRARIGGKVTTVAKGLPKAQAVEARDAYLVVSNAVELREGITLSQFGIGFLERRKRAGVRAVKKDGYAWARHIDADPLGAVPIARIERFDVVEWLDRRTTAKRGETRTVPISHRTRVKLLNLLRVALAEAVERGLLPANPAASVKVHRAGAARSVDDLEGVLTPTEQQALLAAIPGDQDRALVAFALCTGLRQAEQWWLDWDSVKSDRVVISRSTGGQPTKSGKPREVFLLPAAQAALRAVTGRRGFVFKSPLGERRQEGKAPRQWAAWLAAAGITRHVRWHDLRHTCATSLLAGWWGRKWSLDEVCRFLGHSSVTVTERYARKLNESQKQAVSETPTFLIPGGSIPELSMQNPLVPSAFVKRRSRVQVSESAPATNPAENVLDSRSEDRPDPSELGEQNGITPDDEDHRDFLLALAEHSERAEAFVEATRPLAKSSQPPPSDGRGKGAANG